MRQQVEADVDIATALLGDFNAMVHHRELRRLMGDRRRDAGEADGAGPVRTWSPHRLVRSVLDLDHVLIDRGMTARSLSAVAIEAAIIEP